MEINREHVKQTFAKYVANYDVNDEKVKLKIDHTYRVADLCDEIATSIDLSAEDVDLAWLCGMLHDIGRFEQLRRYGTFIDAESVDHALLGSKILFEDNRIYDYIENPPKQICEFLEKVVACHSAYRIPEEYDIRTKMFADILRDADKIDILKVNVEVPLEEIYNVTSEELRNAEVTKEVMESFAQKKAILRALKKTPVDHVVGHISLVFELVYPRSVEIVKEQGYLEKLLNFESLNPKTMEQFKQLKNVME